MDAFFASFFLSQCLTPDGYQLLTIDASIIHSSNYNYSIKKNQKGIAK